MNRHVATDQAKRLGIDVTLQSESRDLVRKAIPKLAPILWKETWIVDNAMMHFKHLPSNFRPAFEKQAAESQRIAPQK